jgi:hypothetical protein
MWRDHFNTYEISRRLGVEESVVYNSMRWVKGE